jgi:hypothetical protein
MSHIFQEIWIENFFIVKSIVPGFIGHDFRI